jgi:hypothetical protein
MVDEAHATGLYGANRRGLGRRTRRQRAALKSRWARSAKRWARAAVTSVAAASLVDFLINRARSFIFSTAPVPAAAAGSAGGNSVRPICRRLKSRRTTLGAGCRISIGNRQSCNRQSQRHRPADHRRRIRRRRRGDKTPRTGLLRPRHPLPDRGARDSTPPHHAHGRPHLNRCHRNSPARWPKS